MHHELHQLAVVMLVIFASAVFGVSYVARLRARERRRFVRLRYTGDRPWYARI